MGGINAKLVRYRLPMDDFIYLDHGFLKLQVLDNKMKLLYVWKLFEQGEFILFIDSVLPKSPFRSNETWWHLV